MSKHKCRTYFLILGDFDAKELLRRMGIKNAEATNRGEPHGRRGAISSTSRLEIGYNGEYDPDISVMIRKTISELLPFAGGMARLKEELGLEYYLETVAEIEGASDEPKPILSLDDDIIEFLYITKTKHDLDYYIY